MGDDHPRRVVIIGGGVAGLAAAGRLQQTGIDAVVVEGRNRLGGRIHTIDVDGSDTAWVDMGAAWIDDHKTNRAYHLLAAVGAGVEPTWPGLTNVRIYDERTGRWLGRVRTLLAMGRLGWRSHRLATPTSEFTDLGERIDTALGDAPRREDEYLLKATTELLDGGPVGHTHPNAFSDGPWEYLRYEEKTSVMVTGGYRHLVDVLADPLDQERIFLEHEVTAIRCGDPTDRTPAVAVETSGGATFEGSHAIVTVPIGVLKADAITFDPPLPDAKQGAIDRMGVGQVEKIARSFPNPFWRRKPSRSLHFVSVPDPITPRSVFIDVSDTAGASPGAPSAACLVAICAAQPAVQAARDPGTAIQVTLAALQRMFPDTYQSPQATAVSAWSTDPFSQGVYSYPTPRTAPGDYRLLGEPCHNGRLLFAGDSCTDGTYLSSVEGAITSGERAADTVIGQTRPSSGG